MYDDVTQAIKCCGATVAPVIKGKFSEKVYMCVCVCVCCVYTHTNVMYLCALYETHRKNYFQGIFFAFSIQKLGNLLSFCSLQDTHYLLSCRSNLVEACSCNIVRHVVCVLSGNSRPRFDIEGKAPMQSL